MADYLPPDQTRLSCPACKVVSDLPLQFGSETTERASDGCPNLPDASPLAGLMHICPCCGFAGYSPDWRRELDHQQQTDLRAALRGLGWRMGQRLTSGERYRRSAIIAVWIGLSNADVGQRWLEAAWCSELEGEPASQARRCRIKAAQYFERALDTGELSIEDEPQAREMVDELRRLVA